MSGTDKEIINLRSTNIALQERIAALESKLQEAQLADQRIVDLNQTIDELRSNEARYRELSNLLRLMCDNVPDLIWAKDLNKRYIFTNKAICRDLLNAVDTDEPIGKNDLFFAERERTRHADNPQWHTFGEICLDTDAITMDSGTPHQFDEYGNIQGKFLFLDVLKAPFIDKNGQVIGTVGSARDVTSAKEAEQTLKDSRQKLALAMELAHLVYWEYDVNTRMFIMNDRFFQQHGTSTELEGGNQLPPKEYIQKFVHPEDRSKVLKAMEEGMQPFSSVKIIEEEYRIIRSDGQVRHILTQAWMDRDAEDRTRKIYGANQDITERKKAEEALADSNTLLQTIINTSPIRVFWKNTDLLYLGCNTAFAKDAGLKHPQELIGKNDFQFVWKNQAELYRADDLQVMESGKSKLSFEEQQTTPDGRKIWLRTSKVPLRNESNEIIGLLGIYEDITARKQEQKEKNRLETQNQQLQKADSLGRMAGAISHHFNNRIQAVLVNLELAMLDLEPGSGVHASIVSAINECYRAAELSGMMLTYLGKTPSRFQRTDLSEVCRRCMPMLLAAVGNDKIFNAILPSQGPVINGNENQIQQILLNLLANACEASNSENHNINITVTTVCSADIPVEHRFPINWQPQEKQYACLEVKDNGAGIPDHQIDKIFDPFFSSKFTGRGLGLSVSLGIIKSHRGAITVSSKPNQGSTFRVFAPVIANKNGSK